MADLFDQRPTTNDQRPTTNDQRPTDLRPPACRLATCDRGLVTSDRSFPPRPIVGVGAVVIDADRVLLVRRAQPPLEGHWSLPGGAVEVGETLSSAIQREVFEETGMVVSVGPIVEVLDRIHTDAEGRVEYHYVLIDYLCTAIGGALQPQS